MEFGTWGGIAAGIFGSTSLGGLGGVSLASQLVGTTVGVIVAIIGGYIVYGLIKSMIGIDYQKRMNTLVLTLLYIKLRQIQKIHHSKTSL